MNTTEFVFFVKCRGAYDACPSYDDEWQEVYDWCPSYDASPPYDASLIICMMAIHHTLRIPKASGHLQRKHQ